MNAVHPSSRQSPYAVLGIPDRATPAEARAAFRLIAKSCHPDVNPDPAARTRFIAAQAAMAQLTGAAASADQKLENGNPRMRRQAEIDLPISIWTAAAGGNVRGSCALGKATVKVPPGTRTGDRIETMIGAHKVICIARVGEADGFRAEGAHIATRVQVSPAQARKGGETELETPNGRIRVALPPNLTEGTRLRIREQGLTGADARVSGDLFLDVTIVDGVADKAVAALQAILAKARGGKASQSDAA